MTYKQRFRSYTYDKLEQMYELWAKLEALSMKYLRPDERSKEKVLQEVILKKFLYILPK